MSELNEVDYQALRHKLTEGVAKRTGFAKQLARETDALLGGPESVLIVDESAFANKGEASAGVARQGGLSAGVRGRELPGRDASESWIEARLYLLEDWRLVERSRML